MRLVFKCIMACIFIFAIPVSADASTERHLSRHYSIGIEVECIETTRELINQLNGYNLDSSAYFGDFQRNAYFTRRVDDAMFRHVQAALREMGEVLHESEHAYHVGAEIMNIETRISVLEQEMERLSLMMAASDSLNVLIAVNDRLSDVSRDRDLLIGRKTVLNSEINNPIINIQLSETPEEPEKPIPASFGGRVSRAFLNSWEKTQQIAGNTLVWFAGSIIPLLIWVIIGGIIGFVVYKGRKKRTIVKEVEHETK